MTNIPDAGIETKRPWPPSLLRLAAGVTFLLTAFYFTKLRADIASLTGLADDEGRIIGGDFVNVWTAAKLSLQGRVATLFDFDAFNAAQREFLHQNFVFHNWSYPPHILPWLLPFGLPPYLIGYGLWIALTFALYAFAVAYKRPQPLWLTGLLLLAPASFQNILAGQYGFAIAACLAGGLRLLPARPALAGGILAFASVKPQLALLVPIALLIGREWRALAAAALTLAALVGLSILCFGIEPWRAYWEITLPFQQHLVTIDPKYEFSAMIPTPFMAARILGASVPNAYAAMAPFALCALAATIYAFARPAAAADRRAGILLTAIFLLSPYALCYDMTALTAAIIAYAAATRKRPMPLAETALIVIVWLLPILVFWLNVFGAPLSPLIVLAFLVLQVWRLREARSEENSNRADPAPHPPAP